MFVLQFKSISSESFPIFYALWMSDENRIEKHEKIVRFFLFIYITCTSEPQTIQLRIKKKEFAFQQENN